MEKLGLGQLIHGEQCRDAIHIAVAPVTAAEDLKPGVHIGFVKGSTTQVEAATNPIGIVDPYLTTGVQKGQSFWMFLYPNTITSLRHDWTHPSFKPTTAMAARDLSYSEQWLRNYAARMNSYDTPERAYELLCEGLRDRELFAHGSDLHGLYDLDDADELRQHAEAVLGIRINWGDYTFSCSC